MKIFIEPLKGASSVANRLRKKAEKDKVGRHSIVGDLNSSDMIILVESRYDPEGKNVLEKSDKIEEKSYIYSVSDTPSRLLPGVYVSMPKKYFDREIHRSYAYSKLKNEKLEHYRGNKRDIKVSFMGSVRNKLRSEMMKIDIDGAYLEDTAEIKFFKSENENVKNEAKIEEYEDKYAEVMNSSKFVLCPRGEGTSSFRLFEAMYCGCVPVIISDKWVPPEGINWKRFSIRVREDEIDKIPPLISRHEKKFREMSLLATKCWNDHFSEEIFFDRVVQKCKKVDRKKGLKKVTNTIKSKKYAIENKAKSKANNLLSKVKRRI